MFLSKLNQKRKKDLGNILEEEESKKLPSEILDSNRDDYNLTKITEASKDDGEEQYSSRLIEQLQKKSAQRDE